MIRKIISLILGTAMSGFIVFVSLFNACYSGFEQINGQLTTAQVIRVMLKPPFIYIGLIAFIMTTLLFTAIAYGVLTLLFNIVASIFSGFTGSSHGFEIDEAINEQRAISEQRWQEEFDRNVEEDRFNWEVRHGYND